MVSMYRKPPTPRERENILAARWLRKGNGRIGKRTARELAKRQLANCANFTGTDFLAVRARNKRSLLSDFREVIGLPPQRRAAMLASWRRYAQDKFAFYGPQFARWPGEHYEWCTCKDTHVGGRACLDLDPVLNAQRAAAARA